MGIKIPRRLRDLFDVDTTSVADGDALTYDAGSETWIPGAGGGGGADDQTAAEVPFTPAGNIAATNVQTALQELDTEKAAATHAHAGEDITSGTVADARIASTIARDSEVTAAVSAHEGASDPHPGYTTAAELASAVSASEAGQVRDGDAAGGVLGGTYPNPAFAADMATQAELDAHEADTTSVHGIADTSALYRSGGTDVAVADGGTGSSTAAGARTNLDVPSNAEAILDSLIDAKGDLLVGTAADTVARLAVGSNDQVLTADSGQTPGVKWATPSAGGGIPDIIVASRSSNTILGTADKGKFIDATAAFTQTLDAAATLGAGWWVDIRNATTDGSSVLTLDPNSSELIDGATTLHMWSGEVRRVICTGSAFVTILLAQGLGLFAQTTSSLTSYSGTEASPTDYLTLGSQTYDAVPISLEVESQWSINSGSLILELWDSSTYLSRFCDVRASARGNATRVITPSAGSHEYKVRAFGNGGNSLDAGAGTGGSGVYPPSWFRALKI